ncbi:hypothetical protein TNCV_4351131 [Trichonephila clavipes]|nr:hypothetical protein TNCV_4351131 [Trichonephila clavipes]
MGFRDDRLIHEEMCTTTIESLRTAALKDHLTDHLIGTSTHASQGPMVTYTGMGTVGPDPQGRCGTPECELFHAEIVEVEICGAAIYRPVGEFHRANSYCHLMVLKA